MHLSVVDNLLLYANRIVAPHSMRAEILQKVNQGHQGIQRCFKAIRVFRGAIYEFPQQCGGPEFLETRRLCKIMSCLSTDYCTPTEPLYTDKASQPSMGESSSGLVPAKREVLPCGS